VRALTGRQNGEEEQKLKQKLALELEQEQEQENQRHPCLHQPYHSYQRSPTNHLDELRVPCTRRRTRHRLLPPLTATQHKSGRKPARVQTVVPRQQPGSRRELMPVMGVTVSA
jgi:hypothetical protein